LAVAFGHARGFFFVDYPEIGAPNAFTAFFYFLTGLGHQAVIVFFVLSGYFVGGAVANSVAADRWTWRQYGLNRMCRLWMVLVPALVLTFFWDRTGLSLGPKGYLGEYTRLVNSGDQTSFDLSATAFLRTLFFLQNITGPVFGSNVPLWSLANEFWYYLLFPLAYLAFQTKYRPSLRTVYFLLFCVGVFVLPPGLVLMGLIWLMGFFSFSAEKSPISSLMRRPAFFMLLLGAFLVVLILCRRGALPYGDYCLGLTFACTLPFLSSAKKGPSLYQQVSAHLSNVSYTLYTVHFPLLAFYFYAFRLPHKSQPTLEGYLGYAAVCGVVLCYATLVWWLFERRTDEFKKWFAKTVFP